MMFPKHTNTNERAVLGNREGFGSINPIPFNTLIFK